MIVSVWIVKRYINPPTLPCPAATFGLSLMGLNTPVAAETPAGRKLSHGGFTTASDVQPQNGLPQDRGDMLAALNSAPPPDWTGALTIYTWGRNFPWRDMIHSLGRIACGARTRCAAVVQVSGLAVQLCKCCRTVLVDADISRQ